MQNKIPSSAAQGKDADFAQMQSDMAKNWFERLKASGVDVEAYIGERQRSYIVRWKEAMAHIGAGRRILDIGGGFSFDGLLEYLRSQQVDYHFLDIDPSAAEATAALAEKFGYGRERFHTGFNSSIPYPDASFDAVFSSHSLEHTDDLTATFAEIHRTLRPDGMLTFAVPIGWDQALREHPYFFSADEWLNLVSGFGFDILNVHIGKTYPESAYDIFVVARKMKDFHLEARVNIAEHTKSSYEFVPFSNEIFSYLGDWDVRSDHTIGLRQSSALTISLPKGTHRVRLVCGMHAWSGIARFACEAEVTVHDLYRWYSCTNAVPVQLPARGVANTLHVAPLFKPPASRDCQVVIYGALLGGAELSR